MASVTVRPVRSRTDRAAFLDFPYDHYAGVEPFVPPLRLDQAGVLNPKKNPFFEHGAVELFLAERDGALVGRVAAIVNGQHLAKYDDGVGFFGFFESVDDPAVSGALLDAAAGWLRARGLTAVRGPVNPTMNDVAGLLVGGFHRPPAVLLPYNHPYYERLLTGWGFERAMTMWAFYVHHAYMNADRMARGAALARRRTPGLTVRTLDMSRFDAEIAAVVRIYNASWAKNWGHVPYTAAEAQHLADEMKPILEPELFVIAELDGEPVAFSASLPNVNRALKKLPRGRLFPTGAAKLLATMKAGGLYELRMALMGVLPAHRHRGIDAVLIHETIVNGLAAGYEAAELSWVLDVNTPLVNSLEKLGCTRDKQYALFEAPLGDEGLRATAGA